VDLSHLNLSSMDLRKIDLENANLNCSDLSNSNLSENFGDKCMRPNKVRPRLKFLQGPKLVNANLFNAFLEYADLRDADLKLRRDDQYKIRWGIFDQCKFNLYQFISIIFDQDKLFRRQYGGGKFGDVDHN